MEIISQNISIVSYNIHGLPWHLDNTEEICNYLIKSNVDILCLQEVFTPWRVSLVIKILQMAGYKVYLPNDSYIQTLFSSGLMICVHNRLKSRFISSCFTPFLHYSNFDIFAAKGFYAITLQLEPYNEESYIRIINTHMQSDCELNDYTGTLKTGIIRKLQANEIVERYKTSTIPTMLLGDLNDEHCLNPWLQYTCCSKCEKVITFPSSKQNLDHIVWIKNGFENLFGVSNIKIDSECDLSDHLPLFGVIKKID
jgi:exonuclease III